MQNYTGVQKFAYFLEMFQELSWKRKIFTLCLAGNNCSQERSWEIHFQGGNTVPGTFLGTFPGMFLGNVSHFSTSFIGNSFSQEKWEYSWEIFQSGKYCSHFSRNVPGMFLGNVPVSFPGNNFPDISQETGNCSRNSFSQEPSHYSQELSRNIPRNCS